jgi:hydrogenase expression/formation protein HypE
MKTAPAKGAEVLDLGRDPGLRRHGRLSAKKITLAHGGGGSAMRDLIDDVFISAFENPAMGDLEDQARLNLSQFTAHGDRLAFTTDGFVVDPLFFPGGDLGKLAVYGTVNDLAVGGAKPLYLSCAMIIEEGVEIELLRRLAASMRAAADEAGVAIVTGDTKVVGKGQADKVFITTAGVGAIPAGLSLGVRQVQPGDVVIVNGKLGDHGAAILAARGDLELESPIPSDCRPLTALVQALLTAAPNTHFIRDCTRGGLASTLNEVADGTDFGIRITESAIPLREELRGFCEILGLDPLYLANEGSFAAFVPQAEAQAALAALRAVEGGHEAAIIGVVEPSGGRVIMDTVFGGARIVDMLVGEQLPRIC